MDCIDFGQSICFHLMNLDQSTSEDSGSEQKVDKTQSEHNAILDLSKKGFKKVPRQDGAQNVKVLILDENELQKIDNIDSYLKIEKVRVELEKIKIFLFVIST